MCVCACRMFRQVRDVRKKPKEFVVCFVCVCVFVIEMSGCVSVVGVKDGRGSLF